MADLRARRFVQLGVVLAFGLSVAACSTMSDIGDGVASLDPTGLLGGDSSDSAPDLANVPSAPPSDTDQSQVASNVNAAGNQAQYSADALRAGTEAAAPPPSPTEAAPSPVQQALAAPAPSAAEAPPSAAPMAGPSTDAPPSADAAPSADAPPSAAAPSAAPMAEAPPSASSAAVPPSPDAAPSASAPAMAAPVRTAALPSGGEPAVPPLAAGSAMRGGMAAPVMSDAALGFRPSSAPPLNPSINQWVSQPILNNYRRTASLSRVASANAAVPALSGDIAAASAGGIPATATIFFLGDGTSLSVAGRAQVRAAVAAFKAQGGSGSLRVVGHASSRTANMPVEKHLELIFNKSQQRANAVAQELIHDGVPAAQVIVEAVGDSQPVYYESMPKGEDGNRRAEIFLQ